MARVAPTSPTPAPTPPIQRGDRATFSARVDQTITYLTGAPAEIYGLATNAYNNALDAFASATAANTSAGTAGTAATNANTYAGQAMGYRDSAQGYATAAQTSATAAASSATALTATSTSSVVLGTGTKTFTVQANKQFAVGVYVTAVNPSDATQWISGPVSAYSGTTLSVNADSFGGTGTVSNWNISVTGQRGAVGATGSLSGGNLTGALYEKAGTDIASAATINPWTAGGNFVGVTGTVGITSIAAAPQAGAQITLLAKGAFPMTSSANLVIKGGSFTAVAGDEIDIRADTGSTTVFRVNRRRADGTAAANIPDFQNIRLIRTMTAFVAPKTGWYEFIGAGTGGQGGQSWTSAALSTGNPKATGGGAAGLFQKRVFMNQGDTALVAPSAATPGRSISAAGNYAGLDGNDTTVTIGSLVLTAGGGKGGLAAFTTGALAGGAGGTASGGDLNFTGGRGGNIIAMATGRAAATGGGAVGVQGLPYSGGDVTAVPGSAAATGGAGTGGKGGDVATTGSYATAGGGGSGGPGVDATTLPGETSGGVNVEGNVVASNVAPTYVTNALLGATGSGSNGGGTTGNGAAALSSGNGGGTGGTYLTGTVAVNVISGYMGGQGGIVAAIPSSSTLSAVARMGGASGGYAMVYGSGTYPANNGTDAGWVQIRW